MFSEHNVPIPVLGAAVNDKCPGHLPKNEYLQQYGSSCYEFVLDHPVDWSHAHTDCLGKGGHLVDIHSYGEQAFLFNACQVDINEATVILISILFYKFIYTLELPNRY